jgi:hypothetical protein
MRFDTIFSIGDLVQITDLETKARVRAIQITKHGMWYLVSWFNNGEYQECYLPLDELKKG